MIYLILILVLVVGFSFYNWHLTVCDKARRESAKYTREQIGDELLDAHYWFTRDPYTLNTLYLMALNLRRNGGLHVSDVRDKADKMGNKPYYEQEQMVE